MRADDEMPPEPIPPPEYADGPSLRALPPPETDFVLVPGLHKDDDGVIFEVGNDDFTSAVLEEMPDGVLYRMEREVGRLDGAEGAKVFRPLTETALRILLDSHIRLCEWETVGRGKAERQELHFKPCSKDHAALVLEAARTHPSTRALKILVSYPVYLPGLVLALPGWNDCGVFYDEPPSLVGVKPKPEGALDVLDDLVIDFPLKDEASRQNLYAAMLTLVCRPAIEGPTPFFLLMAPLERTGKGKLIDTALGNAVRGIAIPPMQASREEAEMEKRVTAQILAGASIVHLDNIPIGEVLDSASLASLATAYPVWSGRRLGGSEIVSLPNRIVVVMSANNMKATGELVKRTIPIVLQPASDHPELRDDFKHPDCYAYALLRRPDVLSALLGIVEKGRGTTEAQVRIGGFEQWSNLVTRSLRASGATAVMGNYSEWCRMADEAGADIETLIDRWALMFSGGDLTAAKVLEVCEALGIFPNVLSKPTPHGRLMALARLVLTPLTNRPVKGWLVQRNQSGSNSTYSLKRATP